MFTINWLEKLTEYYKQGYWTKSMIGDAVKKEKITTEEYKQITNEDYIA